MFSSKDICHQLYLIGFLPKSHTHSLIHASQRSGVNNEVKVQLHNDSSQKGKEYKLAIT